MADESEQATLQAIFRVVNDMRGEIGDLRGEVGDLRGEMNTRFEKQDAELAAIRKVLDEDTATSREVETLGDKLALVQTDVVTIKEQTRETAGQLRRLQSRIDRAGVPAE